MSTITTTMKAIVQDRYGTVDEIHQIDTAIPTPGASDVLVRVHAAGVDAGTWHLTTGRPSLMRVMGFGFRGPKDRVRGLAFSGTVEAVGPEITGFQTGDRVFGSAPGAFAEYLSAPETAMTRVPAELSFEKAAALPISGITALQAVRDAGAVQAGQRVLILGAAGGVGSFAVQLAVGAGATVTAVCSAPKADFVRSLGASEVIDYAETDVTGLDRRWDVIVDIAGNRPLSRLRRILEPTGTLVLVGGEDGGNVLGGMERVLGATILNSFTHQKLKGLVSRENATDLVALAALVDDGTLDPTIDTVYPLAEAPAAIQYVADGRARGKVILTM